MSDLVQLARKEERKALLNDAARRQGALDARAKDLRRIDASETSPEDPEAFAEIQQRFDETFRSLDLPGAPPPQQHESLPTYHARLCSELQPYCNDPVLKALNLFDLEPSQREPFEDEILADVARTVADKSRGDFADPTQLREVVRTDAAGQVSHEWYGDPHAWMDDQAGPAVVATGFKTRDGVPLVLNRRNLD